MSLKNEDHLPIARFLKVGLCTTCWAIAEIVVQQIHNKSNRWNLSLQGGPKKVSHYHLSISLLNI